MEALSLYAKLMNEDPFYAMYAKLQSQQYYMQQTATAAQQVRNKFTPKCAAASYIHTIIIIYYFQAGFNG